jgi:hypothetical protein
MSRKSFLTLTSIVALAVGAFALAAPALLLGSVKLATPAASANVMARTVGVLLITVGVLDFLVRDHQDSPTLRAILVANLLLQLAILPIDPLAYAFGVFHTLGSFVPNTILHLLLAGGFAFYLSKMGGGRRAQRR